MIVDIGGGTTEVAVISLSGIVYSRSVRIAGDTMDMAILNYIKRKYNLLIGNGRAKISRSTRLGYPMEEKMTIEIKGRDLVTGIPKTMIITDEEVQTRSGSRSAPSSKPSRSPSNGRPRVGRRHRRSGIVLAGGGGLCGSGHIAA